MIENFRNAAAVDRAERRAVRQRMHEEYIGSCLNLRQLSKKYGIPYGTVRDWSCRGHWYSERETLRRPLYELRDKVGNAPYTKAVGQQNQRLYGDTASTAEEILAQLHRVLELGELLAPRDLRAIAAAALDLKKLLDLGSISFIPKDQQTQAEAGTREVKVTFEKDFYGDMPASPDP